MNPAKSDLKGTTVTFEQMPSGEMKFTTAGMSYTFKMDGKDYPSLFGMTAAWKQTDANTWESTDKLNGKVLNTARTQVAADGKTMTVELKGTKPNGESFEEKTVYERLSGDKGLSGKWMSKKVDVGSPNVLEFTPKGSEGLLVTIPDFQITADARFDGKDYPATGPQVPAGITLALRKTGARSFEMIEKANGKEIFKIEFAVSADGKTLTETGGATAAPGEKTKVVYDRQ